MALKNWNSISPLLFVFILGLAPTARAQFFAELSYKLWNGDCPKKVETPDKKYSSTTEAEVCTTCSKNSDSSSRLKLMTVSFGESAESAYLASLAEKRAQQLECTQNQITNLQKNPEDLNKFVDDFEAKLTLLGHEKRRMQELKKTIAYDRTALQEYEKSKLRAAALIESFHFSEIAPIRQVINYVVQQHETYEPSRLEGWLSKQSKEMIKKALRSSSELLKSNAAVMQNGAKTFGASLDVEAKESLAQDTELVEAFRNENSRIQNELKPVACKVDAKYGKGAQSRDRTLLAVSILGPTAALGLTKAGMIGLSSSLTGAASVGSISIRTAGMLRVLAATGSSAMGLNQIHKVCFGQDVSLSATSSKNKNAPSCEGNVLASQTKENCLLLTALNTVGVYATTKTVKDALGQIKNGKAEAATVVAMNSAAETSDKSKAVTSAQKTSVVFDSKKFKENPQLEIWRIAEAGDAEQAAKLTQQVEEGLKNSKIILVREMPPTSSLPQLVNLDNGLRGIWKRSEAVYTSGKAEIAAYQVDQKLGLNHVPITVERELKGVKGSLQLFVENADDVRLSDKPAYLIWFDNLIRNRDRIDANYLTVKGRPIAIDNAVSFDHKDAHRSDPDFFADVRKLITPLEQQHIKTKLLETRLAEASNKSELISELAAAKAKEKEMQAIAQNNLSVMLPDRAVYQRLKTTSDQDWNSVLKDQLSTDQIANFLQRRNEILTGMEKVEKVFGEEVFRTGPVSPLVRLRPLKEAMTAADPDGDAFLDDALNIFSKKPPAAVINKNPGNLSEINKNIDMDNHNQRILEYLKNDQNNRNGVSDLVKKLEELQQKKNNTIPAK